MYWYKNALLMFLKYKQFVNCHRELDEQLESNSALFH